MGQSNKPYNKDSSFAGSSTGTTPSKSPGTPSTNELANQVGETRSAISSDIKELGDKFNTDQLKQEAKSAGKEFASGAQEVVIDKAIEVKDAIVEKTVEVKDAIVEKTVEVKDAIVQKTAEATDATVEKLGEAKQAVTEALDDAGIVASRWGRASWRFTTANAFPLALFGLGASWMIMNARRAPKPEPRRSKPQATQSELYIGAHSDDVDQWDPLDAPAEPSEYAGNGRRRQPPKKQRELRTEGKTLALPDPEALIERGKQQAKKGAQVARESLSRAKDVSLDFVDANPLAVAFGTLALGVGVGLLLPTSEREERLLAPTRQKLEALIGDAREVATDVVELAKETANETMARS